jgi:hypothetical protein
MSKTLKKILNIISQSRALNCLTTFTIIHELKEIVF